MTDDEVVEAIKELVAAGEYLDEIAGVPGARLSGGGVFRGDRRLYVRGSREYLEARAAGLVEKLPPLTPASPKAVADVERALGHPLPSLLRRLFLEVSTGFVATYSDMQGVTCTASRSRHRGHGTARRG